MKMLVFLVYAEQSGSIYNQTTRLSQTLCFTALQGPTTKNSHFYSDVAKTGQNFDHGFDELKQLWVKVVNNKRNSEIIPVLK